MTPEVEIDLLKKEIRGIYTTLSASRSNWAQLICKSIANRWEYLYNEKIEFLVKE